MTVSRVAIWLLPVALLASAGGAQGRTSVQVEGTVEATAPAANDLAGTVLLGRYDGQVEHYVTITPQGTGAVEIFEAEGCAPCVVLSPDGTRVTIPHVIGDLLTTAVVSVDGTRRRVLGIPGVVGAWSPDARRVAYGSWVEDAPARTGIYTALSADGSRRRQVTTSGHDAFHEPLAWSPDGRRILFFVERGSLGPVTHAGDLYSVMIDGSDMQRLNPAGTMIGRVGAAGTPASWSPDGRSVAFAAFDRTDDSGRSAVFVANLSADRARRVSPWGSVIASASWSPTDDLIAFSELGGPTLSLMTPNGTSTTLSVRGQDVCCPVWSPDGAHLLVRRTAGLAGALAIVDLEGNVVSHVARQPEDYFGYAWEG